MELLCQRVWKMLRFLIRIAKLSFSNVPYTFPPAVCESSFHHQCWMVQSVLIFARLINEKWYIWFISTEALVCCIWFSLGTFCPIYLPLELCRKIHHAKLAFHYKNRLGNLLKTSSTHFKFWLSRSRMWFGAVDRKVGLTKFTKERHIPGRSNRRQCEQWWM